MFTGGRSLYEAKRTRHPNVHPFPSSVDVPHFARARMPLREPADQARIGSPRLGYFGVLDERLDFDLVRDVAAARPEWQLVFVGPTKKIHKDELPQAENIHYLGLKHYVDLPAYLAGWDVATMPFVRNESTRFISPTKTPEYLAAGKPVVSTSIHDVVHPYGVHGLVRIADTAEEFVHAVETALGEDPEPRIRRADMFLKRLSWDRTWAGMEELMNEAIRRRVDAPGATDEPEVADAGGAGSRDRVAIPVVGTPASLPKERSSPLVASTE